MPIYTNDPCDDGLFPVEPSLRSSIGIGPKVTKAIDAATKDWLDRHPEATTTVEDDSITNIKLKDGSVNSRTIEDESITTDDIADLAITTPKIANDAVDAFKITSSAADGLRIMSTTQPGVAKVGAGLVMNNGALELNGNGDIASAVTAWLNAHPEATTTVEDGSINNNKLANFSIEDIKMSNRNILMNVLGLSVPTSYNVINNSAINPDGSVYSATDQKIYDGIYLKAGESLIVRGEISGGYAAIAKVITSGSTYEMIIRGRGITEINTYVAKATEDGYYAVTVSNVVGTSINIVISKYDLSDVCNVYDILTARSTTKIYTNNSYDFDNIYIGKYATVSGLVDNAAYVSYGFMLKSNGKLWFEETDSTYVSLVPYSDSSMAHGIRYRKTNSENTLPYNENPIVVEKGFYCVISVGINDPAFVLHVDEYSHIDSFNSEIPLAEKHIQQVLRRINAVRKPLVRYVNGFGPHESIERVEMFVPSIGGYILYNFVHTVRTSENADVWRMYEAAAYTETMTRSFNLTTGGEWEMAIHLSGRDDFSGGFMHGDEVASSIVFIIDGVPTDVSTLTELTEINELRVIQTSNVYDPNDHETIFAIHGSEHLFNNDGLTITQSVKWLITEIATGSYLAMFPAAKTAVNKFYTDSSVSVADIEYGFSNDTKMVTLLGNNGVVMQFEIDYQRGNPMSDSMFLITDNSGGQYHKCYFFANDISSEVAAGSVWKSKTRYKLDFGS